MYSEVLIDINKRCYLRLTLSLVINNDFERIIHDSQCNVKANVYAFHILIPKTNAFFRERIYKHTHTLSNLYMSLVNYVWFVICNTSRHLPHATTYKE